MADPLRPEPGVAKAPANVNVLRANIDRYAKASRLGIKRVQQRVFTELMIGVLDNAQHKGVIPRYVVKGGMALELRFGIRARASGDLDVAFFGDDELALLDDALAVGFGYFTYERRKGSDYLKNAKTHRVEIKISYKGRPFGTIDLDVNQAKAETATEMITTSVITHIGLPGPLRVPIIDAHIHLAHKLHAATEPSRADYKNERHRDLVDALIIARDGKLEFPYMQSVVIDEFARREHHKIWPPIWTLPVEWGAPLEALAKLHNFEPTDPVAIEREIIALIARIEGVLVKRNHEYRFLNLQLRTAGAGEPLLPEAQKQFDDFVNDGWRPVLMVNHRSWTDQLQTIFERKLPSPDDLPRLQMRVRTETRAESQQMYLTGNLRNESPYPANKVRLFATNVEEVVKLGNITQGDGDIEFSMRYDHMPLHTGFTQFPALYVQYLTDDGEKVAQTLVLRSSGPDAGQRYRYTGDGFGPSERIDRFAHPHDNGDLP